MPHDRRQVHAEVVVLRVHRAVDEHRRGPLTHEVADLTTDGADVDAAVRSHPVHEDRPDELPDRDLEALELRLALVDSESQLRMSAFGR